MRAIAHIEDRRPAEEKPDISANLRFFHKFRDSTALQIEPAHDVL